MLQAVVVIIVAVPGVVPGVVRGCVVLLLTSSDAPTPVTNTLYHLVARGGGQVNFAVILFSP